MQQHYLTPLFAPQSIAVVGATDREHSVGGLIFANILAGGYRGRLFAVNHRRDKVQGQPAWKSVEAIGSRVDLAIIATPARSVPTIMEECARSGVRNAIVVASGFAESGSSGAQLERRVREIARAGGVRILGPNCLGVMRPGHRLNAAYTRIPARPGDLALVSQSGAMCSAVLDWAASNDVGFSSMISLGGGIDVDFGEVLDYLVHDADTRHILIYVDKVRLGRRFVSALRSAARVKPVILLKAGRHDFNAAAGGARGDRVFDAAVRRAGVVRVRNIDQLFHAAKALSAGFRPRGLRLAIVSNGGGPGAMAADRAGDLGIPLVTPTSDTVAVLDRLLPRGWSHGGLIDIGGDATPERYRDTLLAVARDPNVHSTLVLLAPQAGTAAMAIAEAIRDAAAQVALTVCCCWMGGGQVADARRLLEDAGIPVFSNPDTVIELFHNMARHYRHQKLLVQTPGPASTARAGSARLLIETLLAERRTRLSLMEAKAVLRAFGVPVSQTMVAHSATEALFIAEQIGFPVAMKVDSPELASKSEAGGVRLAVGSTEAVATAFRDIVGAVERRHPGLRINGVSIEPHLDRPNGRELRIGAFRDPVFGPVLSFGPGGTDAAAGDEGLALPPLNPFLARDLMDATAVGRALAGGPDGAPVDRSALEKILVGVGELLCELPWVRELEINPLIFDDSGAVAADVRLVIDHTLGGERDRYDHLAIPPYPVHLVQHWQVAGRALTVRPVRPEDAALEQEFTVGLSDASRRFRFMDSTRELPPSLLARFTQIDYDREMALVAIVDEDGRERQVGSARYALAPDGESVEFAVVVGDDWQHCGLGRRLLLALMDCARQSGFRAIFGDVLADNPKMLKLMEALEFSVLPHPEDRALKRVVRGL